MSPRLGGTPGDSRGLQGTPGGRTWQQIARRVEPDPRKSCASTSYRLPIKGNCSFFDWAPDGRRLLINSDIDGGGKQALFLIDADGAGTAERVVPMDFGPGFVGRMFRIGNETAFIYNEKKSLWLGHLGTPGSRRLDLNHEVGIADISPDGHWLAYESEVSGQREIYVTPFPAGGGN